jgi:ABC-2 type transport system permease protein
MQAFLTLVRRELGSFFLTMTGYVLIGATLLLVGLGFSVLITSLNNDATDMPITEIFYNTQFFWLVLLLVAPVITMRTFAVEKSTGTFETLMTAPVSDLTVVLAKFTAALFFYCLLWVPLAAYPWVLRHFTDGAVPVDAGALGGTFLGIFLFGALYMAVGCFASSLTRSQIIAAMVCFALGIALFLLSFLTFIKPAGGGALARLYAHISMVEHMQDFCRGVVDTRPVVFYLSLTALFLFLTLKVVESRRWK